MPKSRRRAVAALTVISGSRIVLALGVAALVPWSARSGWAVVVSLVLLGLVELSDVLDGYLARRWDAVTDFGKMFDPYSDSVSRLTIYWSLAVLGRCLTVVPLVMAIRDVTVGYVRTVMTRKGMDVSARRTGKLKAVVQGLCAPLLMASFGGWASAPVRSALLWGGSTAVLLVTLTSMVDYCACAARRPGA